ncbi:hypothetical protein GCM10010836_15990 [Aminobacter aminovorans]
MSFRRAWLMLGSANFRPPGETAMLRMLALALAISFVAAPAEAASNKFLKRATSFDSCWMRAYDKAIEKGADARKAAGKADSHCRKKGKQLLKEGGSKYSLKDRRKALRGSRAY